MQEFRKCIECFLCQDVCHVLRDHQMHDQFIGPRFLVYAAALEMHPLDVEDRVADLRQAHGIGLCNITKCCTKVCPEHITITDNAIIPLKERVVDEFFDPLGRLLKVFSRREAPVTEEFRAQADLDRTASRPRCRRPSGTGSSTIRRPPRASVSTCSQIDPTNQSALVTLLLAITDQFTERPAEGARRAQELLPRLDDEYKRMYYAGIVAERGAKAHLRRATVASGELAYHLLREAMTWYEQAEARRPPGNDEAILRWNTCARILARDEHIRPRVEEAISPGSE